MVRKVKTKPQQAYGILVIFYFPTLPAGQSVSTENMDSRGPSKQSSYGYFVGNYYPPWYLGDKIGGRFTLLVPGTDPENCNGDTNSDGVVDGQDMSVLISDLSESCSGSCPGDVDGDGMVDEADIAWLAGSFGKVCPGTL